MKIERILKRFKLVTDKEIDEIYICRSYEVGLGWFTKVTLYKNNEYVSISDYFNQNITFIESEEEGQYDYTIEGCSIEQVYKINHRFQKEFIKIQQRALELLNS